MPINNNDCIREASSSSPSSAIDDALLALQEWQKRADKRQLEIKSKLLLLEFEKVAAA
jgi:hypothetical protein